MLTISNVQRIEITKPQTFNQSKSASAMLTIIDNSFGKSEILNIHLTSDDIKKLRPVISDNE